MQVVIADRTFSIHRTAEPIVRGGERRAGEIQWDQGRIIIDGELAPGAAWETLMHEILEGFELKLPPPKKREKRVDWGATIKNMMAAEIAKMGGVDELMALPLDSGLIVALPMMSAVRLKLAKFQDLTPEQFEIARHLWEQYDLNPWGEDFHVVVVPTPDGEQVKLCPHIAKIREMCLKTGNHGGMDDAVFDYEYEAIDGVRIPTRCTMTVYRLAHDGTRQAFTGSVTWKEAFGFDPERWSETVRVKPETCLEARCEVKVLRKAFGLPLYLRDEFRVDAPPPPRMQIDTLRRFAGAGPREADMPQSSSGMHRMLAEEYGLAEPARRQLIREVADRFGERVDGDDVQFYAAVIKAAARSPVSAADEG